MKIDDYDDTHTPTSQSKDSENPRKMRPMFGRTMMKFNDIKNDLIEEEDQVEDATAFTE